MNIQKNTFMWALLVANLLFNMPTLLKAENKETKEYDELHSSLEALKNDIKACKDVSGELELVLSAHLEKAFCNLECASKKQDKTICQNKCEVEHLRKIVHFWQNKVNNSNK